jgi:Protein of unknown function (DUF1573)
VGEAVPRLKLAQGRYEMGSMAQDEPAHRLVQVSNVGALPLEIGSIEPSRFCSASIDPKTIAPGASGQIEVTCRSDLHGPLREYLLIHSNDPTADRVPVELVANVTPLLAFDAPVVNLEMPFGEERSQDVHLVGTLLDRANLKFKRSSIAPDSNVDFRPWQPDSPPVFRILCHGRKPGMHSGNLIVSTGLPHPKEVAMPYACKVAGTLEISPTNPYFNLKLPGPKLVSIEVRSSQPGFQVRAARVLEGPFVASIEGPLADNSFRVQVKVVEESVKQETRGTLGKIVVVSNDRTEPEKEIPLFGFGKLNAAQAEAAPPAR